MRWTPSPLHPIPRRLQTTGGSVAPPRPRTAVDRAVDRREGAEAGTRRALQTRLIPLAEYRRLWLARSRYGGLEDSYLKFRALAG